MRVRGWRSRLTAACAVALAGVLAAGCAGPSWTYVTNSADRTYMKVPTTWHQVDGTALAGKLGIKPSSAWFTAYDADATPSADHLFGPATASPIMFVYVRDVPESARGGFSLDTLRDMINPVSPSAQQQASMMSAPGEQVTTISAQVLTPGHGLHGVHVVYGKRSPLGSPQVYDQTGYLNDDSSKIYLFVVQCSVDCYQQRQKEITNVVSSFTVRETP